MTMTIYNGNSINPMMSQNLQNQYFQSADADGDGALTEKEFKNFATSDVAMSDEDTSTLFDTLDADGDGLVTSEEMTASRAEALTNLQETLQSLQNLQASQETLQNLVGGVSMIDFINGDADANDVLGLGDWNDIITGVTGETDDSSSDIAALLASLEE